MYTGYCLYSSLHHVIIINIVFSISALKLYYAFVIFCLYTSGFYQINLLENGPKMSHMLKVLFLKYCKSCNNLWYLLEVVALDCNQRQCLSLPIENVPIAANDLYVSTWTLAYITTIMYLWACRGKSSFLSKGK